MSVALDKIKYFWGAYDGVTAALVDEANKDGIWLSSLCNSATLGLPDAELAGVEVIANTVRTMRRKSNLPIWIDADTGFGGGVALAAATKIFIEARADGICIEDKKSPKRNSFSNYDHQLEEVEIFCEKIKIIRSIRKNSDFKLLARTESLVAGFPTEVALKRCEMFAQAGADIIVIHDKGESPDKIYSFLYKWGKRLPVVLIPTSYTLNDESELKNLGVETIILANQLLRASIFAMREVLNASLNDLIGSSTKPNMIGHNALVRMFEEI